ncbi:MAG: hypothetical protein ACFUZC_09805 [Chthoniobacteraceae bacterium]
MNFAQKQSAAFYESTQAIRWLIWVYFALLLLEGALRKWVVPSLANPLLIVRDPVVIAIYIICFARGAFPEDKLVSWTVGLGILSFLISLFAGTGNLLVSIYGWRTDFLHLPLIFVMAKVLRPSDVRGLCIALLLSAVPMAILVLAQFKAGPDAWVNVGVGGGEGGQLDVGFGKIRPPGTFSFTNGLANYLALVSSCLLYAVIGKKYYPKLVLAGAVPAVLLMLVISGSRAAVSAAAISVGFLVLICLRRPGYITGSFKFAILALPGLWVISNMPVFQEGVMVHTARFGENGGGIQHGIIERALGDYIDGFKALDGTPFLGYGLGLGTNAAAGLLGGERGFLLAEGEWARVVKEGGLVFGFGFLLLRTLITAYLAVMGFWGLEQKRPLGLLIFSSCFLLVLAGQFGQPTALGFASFGAGLALAATNDEPQKEPEDEITAAPVSTGTVMRGRSIHAEILHRG